MRDGINLSQRKFFVSKIALPMMVVLQKTLFYDIARQKQTPAAIASVDASNCYNRIAHAMASLIFQSFGVKSTEVFAMLETIQ